VLIARALAGTPDLLVLDEPTSGVDLEHQEVLAQLLTRRLAAGTALLVVLHEAGPLAPLIDRVVRLQDGQVVPSESDVNGHAHAHGEPGERGSSTDRTGLAEPGLEGGRRS
jgi:zinc transport system ATP-binding protein